MYREPTHVLAFIAISRQESTKAIGAAVAESVHLATTLARHGTTDKRVRTNISDFTPVVLK
jgi:hypothetical protein